MRALGCGVKLERRICFMSTGLGIGASLQNVGSVLGEWQPISKGALICRLVLGDCCESSR